MSTDNGELELYKIITEEHLIDELGWVSDDEFCVWVAYYNLSDFMKKMIDTFGYGMFDDGGFDANMQSDGVCIDLCSMLCGYMDIEDVFSKDKFDHRY